MTKVKYDFRIKRIPDWKRVEEARKRLWESRKTEDITYDYDDMLDGGQINYLLLYQPASVIRIADWYATSEYLKNNAPLDVICEESKHSQVKIELEKLIKTPLVKRTKKNTILNRDPSQAAEAKAALFAEALSGCKGHHLPKSE